MKELVMVKILRWGIYTAAFMPLVIFSNFMSPFHFGKALFFRSLIELLVLVYILLVLRDRIWLPPRTPLFWAITAFTLAFGLTTLTSANAYQSFWGSLERMGGWFSFLHFWLYFVIASAILRRKEEWLFLIRLSLVVSLLSASYGLLQKTSSDWIVGAGGRTKIFGTIGNPALFAGYLVINLFLAVTLYFRPRESRSWQNFYLMIFLVNGIAILLAGVRGSVLGTVVGLLLFGALYGADLNSRRVKRWTLIFLGVVLVMAGGLWLSRNSDFVKNNQYLARYSDFSPTTYTIDTRLWAWEAGLKGFVSSVKTVLVGYGPENFNIPFSANFNPKFYRGTGSETLFDRAHNQFVEVLVTMGVLGFLAYLGVFWQAGRGIWRLGRGGTEPEIAEGKIFRAGLLSALVAYVIHNSFIFDTAANYLVFFLLLGLINFLTFRSTPLVRVLPTRRGNPALVTAVGIMLLVGFIWLVNLVAVRPAQANYVTTRAIVAGWNGQHEVAFRKFQAAMVYNTPGKYEIRNRYAQYIIEQAVRLTTIDPATKEKMLVAIEATKKNAAESPRDYLPLLYTSRLYVLLGKDDPRSPYNDLATEYSQQALAVSPTFIRAYFELAQAYLNKKDYPRAIAAFQRAVDLNPDVSIAWWYLGVAQFEGGRQSEGLRSIDQALAHGLDIAQNPTDALRMINIYADRGDFVRVSQFYEELVRVHGTNAQYHASLASVYVRLGRIDEAVREAKLAAAIDPGFLSEAQAFVRSLGRTW